MKFINKYWKYILLGMILVVIVLYFILNMVNIESFLESKGFVKEDDTQYYLKLSDFSKEEFESKKGGSTSLEYDYLYYGLGTNYMSEEIGVYDEDVELLYTGEYNFKTNKVLYSLRGEYGSTVVQFTGSYNASDDSFSCEPLLHHDIVYDNDIYTDVCDLCRYHSVTLHNSSLELIDDERVLNKIIRKTED